MKHDIEAANFYNGACTESCLISHFIKKMH